MAEPRDPAKYGLWIWLVFCLALGECAVNINQRIDINRLEKQVQALERAQ